MEMERKKKKCRCPQGPGTWLTTFSDMTTLLLTFFILMFTTAEIDGHKLRLILSSFTGSFGVLKGGVTLQKAPIQDMGFIVENMQSNASKNIDSAKIRKVMEEARNNFRNVIHRGHMRLTHTAEGLVISILGQVYFRVGSADLTSKGRLILEKIAQFLIFLKNYHRVDAPIIVRGYSSREPDSSFVKSGTLDVSSIWKHNLRLSGDRAENVMIFLTEQFLEEGILPYIEQSSERLSRFIAEMHGEFSPLEMNKSPEKRIWNRRVDILLKQ